MLLIFFVIFFICNILFSFSNILLGGVRGGEVGVRVGVGVMVLCAVG